MTKPIQRKNKFAARPNSKRAGGRPAKPERVRVQITLRRETLAALDASSPPKMRSATIENLIEKNLSESRK